MKKGAIYGFIGRNGAGKTIILNDQRIIKATDGEIQNVFTGYSDKFLVIVGPCSADNEDSVCEYVERLARLNEEVKDKLILIPRIYTNKPRTTGEGYKGMLHQPKPDQAPNLLEGLIAIRKLHLHAIAVSGLTGADEMLYPENRATWTTFFLTRRSGRGLWRISSTV